jgi:glycosyltransferase involved in cell wall biosynthesis
LQLAGLIKHGHDVGILAARPELEYPNQALFERFDMSSRLHYLNKPGAWGHKQYQTILSRLPGRRNQAYRCVPKQCRRYDLAGMDKIRNLKTPDVLHAHFGPEAIQVASMIRSGFLPKPKCLAVSYHGHDVFVLPQKIGDPTLYKHVFALADVLIPCSNMMGQKLVELGAAADKVKPIRVGVSPDFFELNCERQSAGQLRCLCIGRFVEKKGFLYAVEAIGHLQKQNIECSLTLIGSGPLQDVLEAEINKLPKPGAVRFAGLKSPSEIKAMFADTDALLVPSVTATNGDKEGIPTVIYEAFAAGIPVVATRHSGIPEVVIEGETGFLAEEKDSVGLADALERLLSTQALKAIVGAAKSSAQANNTMEAVYRFHMAAYGL